MSTIIEPFLPLIYVACLLSASAVVTVGFWLAQPEKPRTLWRRVKARLTGVEPCSYYTRHGHELKRLGEHQIRGFRIIRYKCVKCGGRFSYDPLSGLCRE